MPKLKLFWNETKLRYQTRTGQTVSRAEVMRSLDKITTQTSRKLVQIEKDYKAGAISRVEWQIRMRDQIRLGHTQAAMLANGGKAQMNASKWGRVGRQTRDQYARLQRWSLQRANGLAERMAGEVRADLYAQAARATFWAADQHLHEAAGFLCTSHTTKKESCSECLAEAGKPARKPSLVKPPGTRKCLGRCGCFLRYVKAG
jgi:hypothetical protein